MGAVLSPTAPDMGTRGILERYTQIRPCFLFVERSYVYAGKRLDLKPKIAEVVNSLKQRGLERVVVVPGRQDSEDAPISEIPLRYSNKNLSPLHSYF